MKKTSNKRKYHRGRKKKTSLTKTVLISLIIVIIIIISVVFAIHQKNTNQTKQIKPLTITIEDTNPKRSQMIEQYLETISEDSEISNDSFSIAVTPVSKEKTVIHIKNNTPYFFTGKLIIHEAITLSMTSLPPNSSQNLDAETAISADQTDFTCSGKLYQFKSSNLLSFPIKEEVLDNDQFKCFLSTNDFNEEAQKAVAYYYYVLDTLYNFSTATEYQLFDETGTIPYGKMIIDVSSQTADFYQDEQLIFTETY